MIYLFDKDKVVQTSVPLSHFNSSHQVDELNGLYTVELVTPMKFYSNGQEKNHKELFDRAVFVGHFDHKERFQLYKIHNRKLTNNKLSITGVHIFFDEAKAGAVIHDRRFRNSEIRPVAEAVLPEIGWQLLECDVTNRYDFNVFRGTPSQFRKDAIETYQVEFDYEIGFDGQKITYKGVRIKNQLGVETNERFAYGTNLLEITAEQDDSEVYTAAIGRGQGEQSVANSKVEFTDVVWSTDNGDPVNKPADQNFVELPSATEQYGYYDEDGNVKPRKKVVEFNEVEDAEILINETWRWVVQNSVPKVVFSSKVFKIGNYELGDSIGIIYKDAGIVRKARVHKIDRNLKDNRKTSFELGDYRHFKKNSVRTDVNNSLSRQRQEYNNLLSQAKQEFTDNFDNMTGLIEDARKNAVAESEAQIDAAETRMQDKLDDVTAHHDGLIDDLEDRAVNLEDFVGDTSTPLGQQFADVQDRYDETLANIGDINGDLETIKTDIVENEKDISLRATKTELTQAVEGIEVGGRNLLLNSDFSDGEEHWERDTADGGRINFSDDRVMISGAAAIYQKNVTDASFDETTLRVRARGRNLSVKFLDGDRQSVTLTTSEFEWYQFHFSDMGNHDLYIGGYAEIDKVKLESGNKTTDWTPAPEDAEERITQLSSDLTVEAGRIDALTSKTDGHEMQIGSLETSFDEINGTVTDISNDYVTQGQFKTLDDEVSLRVTEQQLESTVDGLQYDNNNLLQYTDFRSNAAVDDWYAWLNVVTSVRQEEIDSKYYLRIGISPDVQAGDNPRIRTPYRYELETGQTYTASWIEIHSDWVSDTPYAGLYVNGVIVNSFNGADREVIDEVEYQGYTKNIYRYTHTFVFNGNYQDPCAFYWGGTSTNGNSAYALLRQPKIERGDRRTPWTPSVSETIKQSDIVIESDAVTIGSQSIGGDTIGSVLSVSPTGIDFISEEMRATGDLFVNGDIETMAINAVRADFASLTSRYMSSNIIESDWVDVDTGLIDRIVSTNAFIDRAEIKAANIRDLTAYDIRGGQLQSLNGDTTFYLNSGNINFENGSKIRFHNGLNHLFRQSGGSTGGLNFTTSEGSSRAMMSVGVNDDNGYDPNDSSFRGLRAHSDLSGHALNLVSGDHMYVLARADHTYGGFVFRPGYTGSVSRTIYPYNNESVGWVYNLGRSGSQWRWTNAYLLNQPNVLSDERMKADIEDDGLGLDFVNEIQSKTFVMKRTADGLYQSGFIAQQVSETLNKLDVNNFSVVTKSEDGYYGMEYNQMIPPLYTALKEVDLKIESNTEKIARLESEIKELKGAES